MEPATARPPSFTAERFEGIRKRRAPRRNQCGNGAGAREHKACRNDRQRIRAYRPIQKMTRSAHRENRQNCARQYAGQKNARRLPDDEHLNMAASCPEREAYPELILTA